MALSGYLSVAAIEQGINHLSKTYSFCSRIAAPHLTHEGRKVYALKIGEPFLDGGRRRRPGILILGGMHGREVINPDMLMMWALRICTAYANRTRVAFKADSGMGKVYSDNKVRQIMDSLEIFILPLVNPDGRAYVLAPNGDPSWRGNRNPNAGQRCKGVDLNRNFDLLWSSNIGSSTSPCSEVYKGKKPLSEPETRNIQHLVNVHPNIECMVDVHSYSQLILYPWGHVKNRHDPQPKSQQAVRLGFVPSGEQKWYKDAGARIHDAIKLVRGASYRVQQGVDLYATSGTSNDWSYAEHYKNRSKRRVYSMAFETGRQFQPSFPHATDVMQEAAAGVMELCSVCTDTLVSIPDPPIQLGAKAMKPEVMARALDI